jgi:hypothetical protein
MPGFVAPQLATLKSKIPTVGEWIHEIKYDGYRVQLHISKAGRTVTPAMASIGPSGLPQSLQPSMRLLRVQSSMVRSL